MIGLAFAAWGALVSPGPHQPPSPSEAVEDPTPEHLDGAALEGPAPAPDPEAPLGDGEAESSQPDANDSPAPPPPPEDAESSQTPAALDPPQESAEEQPSAPEPRADETPEPLPSLEGLPGLSVGPDDSADDDTDGGGPSPRPTRSISVRGFVGSEFRIYPAGRDGVLHDEQLWIDGEVEVVAKLSRVASLLVRPRFLLDALDTDFLRAEPLEAYLDLRGRTVEVRLGQMVDNWGIVDTLNPLDVVNRKDFGRDPFDAPALGELGARIRLRFRGTDVFGDPTFTLYGLPLWRRTPLPTSSSRWSFGRSGVPLDRIDGRPDVDEGIFAAARFEHTLQPRWFGADVSYVGAYGPARFPNIVVSAAEDGSAVLVPVVYREGLAGGGFRLVPNNGVLSRFTVKTEVAYHHPTDIVETGGSGLGSGPELSSARPESYTQYVVGLDAAFDAVPGKARLTTTVEFAGEAGADDLASNLRPFDHDFLLRLFWEANDFARSSIEVRGIVDATSGDLMVEGFVGRNLRFIHEDLRLELGGRYIHAARNEPGILSVFRNNSDLRARLQLDF